MKITKRHFVSLQLIAGVSPITERIDLKATSDVQLHSFHLCYMYMKYVETVQNHNVTYLFPRCGPTKAGQAACILLHTLWNHSELHTLFNLVGPYMLHYTVH